MKKTRVPSSLKLIRDYASLSEVIPTANQLLQTNQMYQSYRIQLANFPRARTVAQGYQLFRIKRVTFKFSPLADTFQVGAAQTTSVPYLYCMIDRTKNLVAANSVDALKRAGAKPRRLDDKMLQFTYSPNVLTGSFDANPPAGQSTTQFTQFKVSPWLNTRDSETLGVWNPDTTDHLGCVWYAENSGGNEVPYKVDLIVEFEFKKPSYQIVPLEGAPQPIEIIEDISSVV